MQFLMRQVFLSVGFFMISCGGFAHKGQMFLPMSPKSPASPMSGDMKNNTSSICLPAQQCSFEEIGDFSIPNIYCVKPLKWKKNHVAMLFTDGSIKIFNLVEMSTEFCLVKTIMDANVSIKNDGYDRFIGALLELAGGRLVSVVGTSSGGARVNLWDLEKCKNIGTCSEKCLWHNPLLVTSKNNKIIAFRSDASSLILWDIKTNKTEKLGVGNYILPNGCLVTRKKEGRTCIYDLESRAFITKFKSDVYLNEDFDTATSVFQNTMAFISRDGKSIILHGPYNKNDLSFVAHGGALCSISSIAIDLNTYMLFSADKNGVLKMWVSDGSGKIKLFGVISYSLGIRQLVTDGENLFIVFDDNYVKILKVSGSSENLEKELSRFVNTI